MENQVAILYALTNGFLDDVEVSKIKNWEADFQRYLDSSAKEVLSLIAQTKELTDDVVAKLEKAIKDFKDVYQSEE
jgi:F-type H+-transporting ATPase subunit alpha